MKAPVTIGVVGLGRRGRRLLKAFEALPRVDVRWLCDVAADARRDLRGLDRERKLTAELDDLLCDDSLDAVAIAVPAESRGRLVARALEADKHVLSEAPMTLRTREVDELQRQADRGDRLLMHADTLPVHAGVVELKQMLRRGRLGELYYLELLNQVPPGSRTGDEALWDLVAGDVSAALHLLDDEPIEVFASGDAFENPEAPEIVLAQMRFATGIVALLRVSLLDARPAHRIVAVGSRRTAVFDELQWMRMLALYERSPALADLGSLDDELNHGLAGGVVFPTLSWRDPVHLLCERFVSLIAVPRKRLRSAGNRARAVVAVVETLHRSLAKGGAPVVALEPTPGANVSELRLESRSGGA